MSDFPEDSNEFNAHLFGEPATAQQLQELENIAETFLENAPFTTEQACIFSASPDADDLPQGFLYLQSQYTQENPDTPSTSATLTTIDSTLVASIEFNEQGAPCGYSLNNRVDKAYATYLLLNIASNNNNPALPAVTTILRTVLEQLNEDEATPSVATEIQKSSQRLLVHSLITTIVRASRSPMAIRKKVEIPLSTGQFTIENCNFAFLPEFSEEDFDLADTPKFAITYQDHVSGNIYYYVRQRDDARLLEICDLFLEEAQTPEALTEEHESFTEDAIKAQEEHGEEIKSKIYQPMQKEVNTLTALLLEHASSESGEIEDTLQKILEG